MDGSSIAAIAMIGGMILGGIVAVTAMFFHHQRQRLWHETARVALEKGQPLPPMPDTWQRDEQSTGDGKSANRHDLRGGLILLAVGVGVYLWLGKAGGHGASFLGTIPAFIGVALLLNYAITSLTKKRSDGQRDS